MQESRSRLPQRYQLINSIGKLLLAAGFPILRLDEETLSASAMKIAGLADFGDPYYREGLTQLLLSAEEDANLTPIGRITTRDLVTNYLVQRLKLVETRKQMPEIFNKSLIPPIIITGSARSGTTFLHNMLAIDPPHRALPQWLLMQPFPEKDWNGEPPDPRIEIMEKTIRMRQPLLPGLDSIHYQRADTAEECILALGLTFNSLIFGTLLPVAGYMEWYLHHEDNSQKYREYRWLLQVFQSQDTERRLTLKAPAHTGNLKTLLEAIPDAMVIQTHRDPVACISSACSLITTFHKAVSDVIDIQRMTRLILEQYDLWYRRNLAFREANPGVIYDVNYDSLVADPLGTVRGIYTHFDLPWTEVYASELQEFILRHPKNKHGKHHYSTSDFGLTEGEIVEKLQFYNEYFGLKRSQPNNES